MKVQLYNAYSGLLLITAATPRPQMTPSTKFTAAGVHEDYCARVRALLREHKQVGPSSLSYASTKRLQAYFPTHGGSPLYAIRELKPAGTPRDVDPDVQLEIMRIRYEFTLNLLPAAFAADELIAEGIERAMEHAVRSVFQANDVPDVFIPGYQELRPEDRTVIDIICELGAATSKAGYDIPDPATG